MEYLSTAEIREKYLSFFEAKGCKRMPSSSLIPDDPSLLLTSAGMVQFKPYFLQQKHLEEPYVGTTTVQKCVRTNDIDIIGTTGRHLSFFEMLGNFSFGKYFKKEMCAWAYEFSTEVLGLPAERLYFTVYLDDDEDHRDMEGPRRARRPHLAPRRGGQLLACWPHRPVRPLLGNLLRPGPEEFGCGSPDCAPGCDCDRFLEYWNLVFTQYDGQEDGIVRAAAEEEHRHRHGPRAHRGHHAGRPIQLRDRRAAQPGGGGRAPERHRVRRRRGKRPGAAHHRRSQPQRSRS